MRDVTHVSLPGVEEWLFLVVLYLVRQLMFPYHPSIRLREIISTQMPSCIPVPLTPRSTTLNQRPPFTLSAQKTNAPSAPA